MRAGLDIGKMCVTTIHVAEAQTIKVIEALG